LGYGRPEPGEQKTAEAKRSAEGTEKPPESQGEPSPPVAERIREFGKQTGTTSKELELVGLPATAPPYSSM